MIDRFETIMLLLLLAVLFYLSLPLRTEKNLRLEGDSWSSIIAQLQRRGYAVGAPDAWLLERLGSPQAGWVYLGKNRMERLEFLHRLAAPSSRFRPVTLIPGETTLLFLDELAKTLDKNATRLREAYRRLSPYPEAGILAESYNVPLHYSEERIVNYLLNLSERRYRKLAAEAGIPYDPKNWQRILTIASIIQKEAANRREMPLVASVIVNRLKKRMRLQMDGTLNYGRYSHVRVTPQRIRATTAPTTPTNTAASRKLPSATSPPPPSAPPSIRPKPTTSTSSATTGAPTTSAKTTANTSKRSKKSVKSSKGKNERRHGINPPPLPGRPLHPGIVGNTDRLPAFGVGGLRPRQRVARIPSQFGVLAESGERRAKS